MTARIVELDGDGIRFALFGTTERRVTAVESVTFSVGYPTCTDAWCCLVDNSQHVLVISDVTNPHEAECYAPAHRNTPVGARAASTPSKRKNHVLAAYTNKKRGPKKAKVAEPKKKAAAAPKKTAAAAADDEVTNALANADQRLAVAAGDSEAEATSDEEEDEDDEKEKKKRRPSRQVATCHW